MTRARARCAVKVAQAHLAAFGTEFQLCFSSYPYRSLRWSVQNEWMTPPTGMVVKLELKAVRFMCVKKRLSVCAVCGRGAVTVTAVIAYKDTFLKTEKTVRLW